MTAKRRLLIGRPQRAPQTTCDRLRLGTGPPGQAGEVVSRRHQPAERRLDALQRLGHGAVEALDEGVDRGLARQSGRPSRALLGLERDALDHGVAEHRDGAAHVADLVVARLAGEGDVEATGRQLGHLADKAAESFEALGTALKLPPQFEAYRAQIEAALPPLD